MREEDADAVRLYAAQRATLLGPVDPAWADVEHRFMCNMDHCNFAKKAMLIYA